MISKFANASLNKTPSSVIIRTTAPKHETKIQVKELVDSCEMSDDIFTFCSFKVSDSGYYSVSSQLCLRNSSAKNVKVNFFQLGICKEKNYESDFVSRIVASAVAPEYLICEKLSSVIHLAKDCEYTGWINFSSTNNSAF